MNIILKRNDEFRGKYINVLEENNKDLPIQLVEKVDDEM